MDHLLFGSFCVCFPSFPDSRSWESNNPAAPRDLPDYSGPVLSEKAFEVTVGAALPRVLPLKPETYPVQPPPYYPGGHKPSNSTSSTSSTSKSSSLEVKPLRLVRASRKRRASSKSASSSPPPPAYVESYSHDYFQSVTTLSIESLRPAPPPYTEKMAVPNPSMPKVGTMNSPPSGPGARPFGPSPSSSSASQSKDDILADLRRQLDDSASDLASSVDSRGRRRRRNNKQLATSGGIKTGAVLPRLAETKPVRLQLGLNLDVEVELKARLQGDVSLTLL